MAKTWKVMEINVEGIKFECIFKANDKHGNCYKLYQKWYDCGWHQRKLEEYANFISVILWIKDYAFNNRWGFKDPPRLEKEA